ncbi:MAG: hemerythrin domain-containing protein [Blastomonas sp.]
MTDIYSRLKQDHDKHRKLLAKIAETHGDSAERRELFEAFRVEVTAHANAEEQTLYAYMLEDPDLQDEGRHSVAEHKNIDDMLEELSDMDMSSPGWLTRFKALRHCYEHHIEEEEEEIFVAAEKVTRASEERKMADKFDDRKADEKAAA